MDPLPRKVNMLKVQQMILEAVDIPGSHKHYAYGVQEYLV